MTSSTPWFEKQTQDRLALVEKARSQRDYASLRSSLTELAESFFSPNTHIPGLIEDLRRLGWTPLMAPHPKDMARSFAREPVKAREFFSVFPEHAAWMSLDYFIEEVCAPGGVKDQDKTERLNNLLELPCFSSIAIGSLAQSVFIAIARSAKANEPSSPGAEALMSADFWKRSARDSALECSVALIRAISSPLALRSLCDSMAQGILTAKGPASQSKESDIRIVLLALCMGGNPRNLQALMEGDERFLSVLKQSVSGYRRPNEPRALSKGGLAEDCANLLLNSFAGRALASPTPEMARLLVDLGADAPQLTYLRDEMVSSPKQTLAMMREPKDAKEASRGARKLARAKAMIPQAIFENPQDGADLLAALNGAQNPFFVRDTKLSVPGTATFVQIALIGILGAPNSFPDPQWGSLAQALELLLEPNETLQQSVVVARELITKSHGGPVQLDPAFEARLERLDIQGALAPRSGSAEPARRRLSV